MANEPSLSPQTFDQYVGTMSRLNLARAIILDAYIHDEPLQAVQAFVLINAEHSEDYMSEWLTSDVFSTIGQPGYEWFQLVMTAATKIVVDKKGEIGDG